MPEFLLESTCEAEIQRLVSASPLVQLLDYVCDDKEWESIETLEEPDKARYLQHTHPFALVVLRSANGRSFLSWGVLPFLLIAHAGGKLHKKWCVDVAPATVFARTPLYLQRPEPHELPQTQTCLLSLEQALKQRLKLYAQLAASQQLVPSVWQMWPSDAAREAQDRLCFLAMMHVVATPHPARDHIVRVFTEGEKALALHRLAWSGEGTRLLALAKHVMPDARVESDSSAVSADLFKNDLVMLLTPPCQGWCGVQLSEGRLMAPPTHFAPTLLARYGDAVLRDQVQALLREPSSPRDTHVGFGYACGQVHERMRMGLFLLTTVREESKQTHMAAITGARLEEVMPLCMKKLHQVALGRVPGRHLRYDERQVFYPFMLLSGVTPDALVQLQWPAHAGRTDVNPRQYMVQDVEKGVQSTAKWLQSTAGNQGTSCRTMHAAGRCGFSDVPFNLALRNCQLDRAARLGNSETDTPTGYPLLFAQQLRRDLDAKAAVV